MSFYKLVEPNLRNEILNSFIKENIEIVLKIDHSHFRTKIASKRSETEFLLTRHLAEKFKNEAISGTFEYKRNKYFIKTILNSNLDGVIISVPTEVFLLQRRNNFRMVIPIGVKYVAELQTINGRRVKEKVEIRDISLGGCQFVCKKNANTKIQTGDDIQIKIQMLDLDKELIAAEARHVMALQSDTKLQVGINFIEPDGEFLTKLQNLLMHLDRVHRGKKYD